MRNATAEADDQQDRGGLGPPTFLKKIKELAKM